MKFLNFFQTRSISIKSINVYDFMIFSLSLLAAFGIYKFGIEKTLPQIFITIFATSTLDFLIKYFRHKKFLLPKTGIISGLFISTILEIGTPYHILLLASAIAILSKNLIRYKGVKNNIFNPAMLSLLIVSYFFDISLGWWLVVDPLPIEYPLFVFILGSLIIYSIKGYDLFFSFIITYFLLFSILSLENQVVIFNELRNWVIYFFAFFMLTDPKTSPSRTKGKILYGALVALLIALIRFGTPIPQFAIPLGLIIGNLFVPLINLKIK